MLVLPVDGPATLVVPRLERAPALALAGRRRPAWSTSSSWDETDDPIERVAASLRGEARDGRLLLSDHLWAMHALALQARFVGATFGLAPGAWPSCVPSRTPTRSIACAPPGRPPTGWSRPSPPVGLIGRSEAEVAREVRERLVDEGHDEAAFAIVASGPNSASPHHEPGDRRIGAGDAIVLDIGGVLQGYCSDTTRTLWVTGDADRPDPDFLARYAVLQRAQAEATCGGPAGHRLRGDRRQRADGHHRRGLRRLLHPSDGSRHRPRGPRGSLHRGRQSPAAAGRACLQHRARHLCRRPRRCPHRGHRRLWASMVPMP